jgi:cytochrome oxidase Cu insertion factor (SCO1/SenC/PrrC family)
VKLVRAAWLVFVVACGTAAKETPVGVSTADTHAAISFQFDSLDARPVNSAAMAGKPTVIAFITTGDTVSQAQVTFLNIVAKEFADKANFVLVALQGPTERELVEIYRDMMKVTYPVAMGDAATIAGGGAFGDVHAVPTTVILDGTGHVVYEHVGLIRASELRAHLH